jgi:hypothetical protein
MLLLHSHSAYLISPIGNGFRVTNHEGLCGNGGLVLLILLHFIESSASNPGRSLSRKELPVPIKQTTAWTTWKTKKSVSLAGNWTTNRPVSSLVTVTTKSSSLIFSCVFSRKMWRALMYTAVTLLFP